MHTLQWCHNGHNGISNHQPHNYLLNHLFRCRPKKISKFRVTGLCAGHSTVTGEFPVQRASNTENVSIWWHVNTITELIIGTAWHQNGFFFRCFSAQMILSPFPQVFWDVSHLAPYWIIEGPVFILLCGIMISLLYCWCWFIFYVGICFVLCQFMSWCTVLELFEGVSFDLIVA